MIKAKALMAALPMGAAVLAGSTGLANAAFPNIGADTNGPSQIITISSTGVATVADVNYASFPHPYDGGLASGGTGSDDTYIGVVNNFSGAISALTISCTGTCFGFDGDGIGTAPYNAGTNASDTSSGHYGGPNAFYSNINAATTSGIVHFVTALGANCGTTCTNAFFSLELPLSAANFSVTVGGVPLPSSWTMMLMGFAGLGFLSYRARKKTSEALLTA